MKTEEMKNYQTPLAKVVNVTINGILCGSVTGDVDDTQEGYQD